MLKLLRVFFFVGVGGVILAIAGVGGVIALESQDAFCASCHTEPEATYFQRSLQEKKVDLASFHSPQNTRCIDCHSGGGGAGGRLKGLQQGARDLAAFVSGNYHRPAITTNPLGDESCTQCHTKILERKQESRKASGMGLLGHYHFYLLQWQAEDKDAARCITCHPSHTTGLASLQFMPQGKVGAQCDLCHTALSGKVK